MFLRTLLTFCVLLLLLPIIGLAQERFVCGNTYEDQMQQIERFLRNKKMATTGRLESRNNMTQYIPLKIHLVTENDGTGLVPIFDVLGQMCHLNETFENIGLQFYIKDGVNIINSDVIYDNHTSASGQFSMRQRRDTRALNVWVVNNAAPSGGSSIGTVLGYYDQFGSDWVVIKNSRFNGGDNTLAHEIGHFFSLSHPHLGWDSDPYDPGKHGNPVNSDAPNGSKTELVDRSNCETAGDMLCDTPPDYNFALSFLRCNFDVTVTDPNGDLVDPDESLIMSYFQDECTSVFTESQIDIMVADAQSSARNYLRTDNSVTAAAVISEELQLIAPINEVTTPAFNKVTLSWGPVANAESYLVEIDRSTSFNIDKIKFTTDQTSVVVEDLLTADRNYRWRVTPYNDTYFCAPSSTIGRFTTGISTSVPELTKVDSWSVNPNPIPSNQAINIQVDTAQPFEAAIELYNLTGQKVRSIPNQFFTTGQTFKQLPANDLDAGMYFLQLTNEEGILTKKIVIQ